jgi:thiol-disulfide isomerase/thioredoxin
MKGFLGLGGVAGLLLVTLFACGKKLPTPPPPPPGQNDTTRVVLAEIFSARLCTNCPRADSALHALVENYGTNRVIAIEYHPLRFAGQPDSLGTPETDARKTYYNVTSFPTCFFGGLHKTLGAPINVYEVYRDSFSVESARRSPVSLGLSVSASGVATVTVKALGSVPSSLVLQTVVVLDSIEYRTLYKNFWRFVAVDLVPDQNGDTLRLAEGDSLTRTKGFSIQSNWNLSRLYVVAFLQNPANREILQSAQVKLIP